MSLKARILEMLEDNRGRYISGAELADMLAVSRNAVWKAVRTLLGEGHEIDAVKNRGYMLTEDSNVLSEAGIKRCIGTDAPFAFEIYRTVTSTNTVLKELAAAKAPEGLVVAAWEQTGGKGRLGRGFYSPGGHGAYFSILLRPNTDANTASLITSAAAVAVAEAIEELSGVRAGIKWVNDVFVGGKKVCGILTEASVDMENGLVSSAVLGIGINVTKPEGGVPDELRNIVTVLEEHGANVKINSLIAAVLGKFWTYYMTLGKKGFLVEYRNRSILIGNDITVILPDGERPAVALDIDDECRLIVRYDTDETASVNSGEVSVRKQQREEKGNDND